MTVVSLNSSLSFSSYSASRWPKDPAGAFIGLAGDVARAIEPHSESDPVAILAQTLTAFGSLAGRGPHVRVEADDHPGRLYVALVGETSRGRKGTSWGHVRRLFESVDQTFPDRIDSGLSSGEGLIYRVRDPLIETVDGEEKTIDDGVADKRVLVVETELASTLKQLERQGNTLSPVLRSAWDGTTLATLTRNSRLRATGTHISVIGHITVEELRRRLDETEAANGFGNRFLWIAVTRSKLLPDGGTVPSSELNDLSVRLHSAYRHALKAGQLQRDDLARELWHDVYEDLSAGAPGLLGALTTRAEAQVTRLSLLYALLDEADAIGAKHLTAALELWQYAAASVAYVFGDSTGNPDADAILRALRETPGGLTRTDLFDLFKRNISARRIDTALATLLEQGRAHRVKEATDGRPAERWLYGRTKETKETKKGTDDAETDWLESLAAEVAELER
jgi:hypothetical protein